MSYCNICARTDQDGDGVLHYAEFVSGLLYINSKVDDAQAARLAFGMMDKNKDGKVRKEIDGAADSILQFHASCRIHSHICCA